MLHVVRGPRRAFDRICLDEALFRDPLKRAWLVLDPVHAVYEETSVILGISGKVPSHVHEVKARADGVELLRRFSGGGTVVVNQDAFLVSIIGNASKLQHANGAGGEGGAGKVKPYPREIMQWTADAVYAPAFARAKSASAKREDCQLTFRENDYVMHTSAKIGGNAQAISGDRFCHHTSFLWRVNAGAMSYLRHPDKAPEYRKGRDHLDFLQGLENVLESKEHFLSQVLQQVEQNIRHEGLVYLDADKDASLLPPMVQPSRNYIL